ncbi:MAG: BatA domain-containing protein [Mucilaginibacter polytrichastri]|nr:BatA domain-containing protein [Mucilaginibacter polytrichastri]
MSFLSPIWFFALTALAVPVAIHLWNTRRGRTLRVGSISWLLTGNRQNRRSVHLTEWLLLLLRCTLIAFLVALLAGPFFRQSVIVEKTKGWLLIAPEVQKEAFFTYKNRVDSLQKAGYELHAFSPGFEKLSPQDTQKTGVKTAPAKYWSLLRQLGEKLPRGFPVTVISDARLAHFSGKRPESVLNITWKIIPPTDTLFTSEKTSLLKDGSPRSAEWISTPQGNRYRFSSPKNQGENSSAADTARLSVALFAPEKSETTYFHAAVSAIQDFSGRRIDVREIADGKVPAKTDFLFWLSQKPVPETRSGMKVFRYASGRIIPVHASFSLPAADPVFITKIFTADQPSGETIWQTETSAPVLTKNRDVYTFYSRLDPAWNDLVWHPAFAENLLTLLMPMDRSVSANDRSELSAEQILPVQSTGQQKKQGEINTKSDLRLTFWIILALLILAERIMAHRRKEAVA